MSFKFRDPGKPTKACIENHKAIIVDEGFGIPPGRCCYYRINEARELLENLSEVLDEADAWIEKHQGKELSDQELLAHYGWTLECESPFEIRHKDGSFATLNAAWDILHGLRYDRYGNCPVCGPKITKHPLFKKE